MEPPVLERVERLLRERGVTFHVLRHQPVYTSDEAARVRGLPLASGAKALVCKEGEALVMFVLPGDRKLASHLIRRSMGWRHLRFATPDELAQVTGLTPGSVPPFGSLFGIPTLCDRHLAENEFINFNAGDLSVSIVMRYEDYQGVEAPQLGSFTD